LAGKVAHPLTSFGGSLLLNLRIQIALLKEFSFLKLKISYYNKAMEVIDHFLSFREMSPDDFRKSKSMSIVVDTNILVYRRRKDVQIQIDNLTDQFKKFADKFHRAKVNLIISQVSIFELLTLTNLKSREKTKLLESIADYVTIPVNSKIQYFAAKMSNYYRKKGLSTKEVDIADLYIGVTAALTATPILTANQSHYPPFFFEEIARRNLSWKENGRTKSLDIYLLNNRPKELSDDGFYKVVKK